MNHALAAFFKFKELGTNVRTELTAGATTYMTMAYIIFVQPAILSQAGMDQGAVMMATCLAAAVASVLMGLWANYPIALAPGLGENFFFAFTVVIGMGVSWQAALACVFVSGVVFMLLTFFKIREMIIDSIPESLRAAIAGGIGLFIAFIGLTQAGIVQRPPSGIIELGDMHSAPVVLAIVTLLLTAVLMHYRIRGAILIGMIVSLVAALALNMVNYEGILSMPPSLEATFFQFDFGALLSGEMVVVIVVFLFMDLFDTTGTLVGVCQQAGLMKDGKLPRASRALFSDAVGTTFGAVVGTCTVTSYIESASGVQEGGRSGMTAIVAGLLFLLSVFIYPIVKMVGAGVPVSDELTVFPITSPALILVGSMMLHNVKDIDWKNVLEAIPSFLVLLCIPLTFSIADGLAFGFVSYPVLMLAAGKGKQVSPLIYILGLMFVIRYAIFQIG